MTDTLADQMSAVDMKDEDRKRPDYLEWAEYFMAVSFLSAMRSKDPATQVGACIVSPDNRIVNNDLALRAQLTEFRDHKLIRSKKGVDGGEYLTIPLDKPTLTAFLENIQDN